MKKAISVVVILSLCLLTTGQQVRAQTNPFFPCNYGVIFALFLALATSWGNIAGNTVAGIQPD